MSRIIVAHNVAENVLRSMRNQAEVLVLTGDRQELLQQVGDADAIHGNGSLVIDEELLAAAPRLKIVALSSVGYNNLDLEAMRRHGVVATNVPGVLDDTLADLTMGLLIGTARRLAESDRMMRAGIWRPGGKPIWGVEISGKTMGIIGMGRIGQAIARRGALGMSMPILYHNRHRNPQAEQLYGAELVPLDELMSQSDYVVIAAPLTPETRGMVGEHEIGLMKPTAVLVNIGRGPIVDEQALIRALQEGRIFGAGLDVFEKEPLAPDSPLLKLNNVMMVPHIGSETQEARERMADLAARNILSVLRGEGPLTPVPEFRDFTERRD
ncbi:MAG: D-glycerate dehydrogenase [Firmicutes bacterium]|nr:D-glycerate dehydrogenase [Bacillota bacterium]